MYYNFAYKLSNNKLMYSNIRNDKFVKKMLSVNFIYYQLVRRKQQMWVLRMCA